VGTHQDLKDLEQFFKSIFPTFQVDILSNIVISNDGLVKISLNLSNPNGIYQFSLEITEELGTLKLHFLPFSNIVVGNKEFDYIYGCIKYLEPDIITQFQDIWVRNGVKNPFRVTSKII